MNKIDRRRRAMPGLRTLLTTALAWGLIPVTLAAEPIDDVLAQAVPIRELQARMDAGTLTSEALVDLALARIAAYDDTGPAINAILRLDPDARAHARALDEERLLSGARSPLHGIPVVLKDNLDTADLPTTAGSVLLAGSLPPDDAHLTRRLRAAGAIVLAKVNMSEFASGGPFNSLDGPTFNPHDTRRSPSGSSGGTGAAVAAAYAPLGLGTDTGGSVRGPSTANGLVGLKPTLGLLSRDGIIPLALSFDTAGPMVRRVEDLALALNVLAGVDPSDDATRAAAEHIADDYTAFLDAAALEGGRIGVARDFMEQDREVDWIVESALDAMRDAGAETVDVRFPSWLLESRGEWYRAIRYREFRAQIADYLQTLGPEAPKSLAELIDRAHDVRSPSSAGTGPNPSRWSLMLREEDGGELTDPEYRAVHTHALALVRATLRGIMDDEDLDAIVYPTNPRRPDLIDAPPTVNAGPGSGGSPVILANLSGFPDLIMPAGFTARGLPVGISFLGRAWSEPRLIALAYAFEQRTQAWRLPLHTPALGTDFQRDGDEHLVTGLAVGAQEAIADLQRERVQQQLLGDGRRTCGQR